MNEFSTTWLPKQDLDADNTSCPLEITSVTHELTVAAFTHIRKDLYGMSKPVKILAWMDAKAVGS